MTPLPEALLESSPNRVLAQGPVQPQPLRKGDFGFLKAILDLIESLPAIQLLLAEIYGKRSRGRPGYPPRAMLRAFCVRYLWDLDTTRKLIHDLHASPELYRVCGFEKRKRGDVRSRRWCVNCKRHNAEVRELNVVQRTCLCRKQRNLPSESTFSKFFKHLTQRMNIIDEAIDQAARELGQRLPEFGEVVIIDSTDIDAYAHPNRKIVADPDATWGVHRKKRERPVHLDSRKPPKHLQEKKLSQGMEYFFGYKLHTLVDAVTSAPLASIVLPANVGDTKILPVLVREMKRHFPDINPRYLIADRGYDSLENHAFALSYGITPIIHIRKPSHGSLHDGIYTVKGSPTCIGGKKMEYVRTDPKSGKHLYRCPEGGCDRLGRIRGWSTCRDWNWEDPRDNLRVISVVARADPLWGDLYDLRSAIERLFNSLKESRLLNSLRYLGFSKTRLHSACALLTYTVTVLLNIMTTGMEGMRRISLDRI